MSLASNIVKRPVLGIVVFGLIAIVAFFLVSSIAIDMFPDLNMPYLIIITTYQGAGPETVEKTVTKILESTLVNISGLKKISSTSYEGISQIVMEFNFGVDIDIKTNDARDQIDRVKALLPDNSDAPIIRQIDPNSQPIIHVAVKGNRTANELQDLVTNSILDLIDQVDGVATSTVTGGAIEEVRVDLNQNRLEAYGLTISGVAAVLANQNLELGAGTIDDGSRNYSIRTTGEYATVQDIAETVIASRGGADIRLLDIGDVSLGFPDETSCAYINGQTGVFISITKQSGTNTVAVANNVYKKLKEIKPQLPQDVSLEIIQDQSTQIRDMVNELVNSAWQGLVLAMAILFLFLRNIKSTVIIGISIPFSILVTLLVMNIAGLTLNMLTMTGLILGIGLVTDCSIVILENIFKYRERGTKPDISAILGSQEVMTSIISSTITTLCVFIPIILFKNALGFIGIMVQDLIITVGISLASSLFVAIFLVPILASKYMPLYTRTQKPLHNKLLLKIDNTVENGINAMIRAYGRALSVAVQYRVATSFLVFVIFVSSIFMMTRMPLVMIPPLNEDNFTLNVALPQGTLYEDEKATMLQIQDIAQNEIQGLKSIVTSIGSSSQGSIYRTGVQDSMAITLDLDKPGADTSESAKNRLRARFNDFPMAVFTFAQGRARMMSGSADIDLSLHIIDIMPGLAIAKQIKELIEEKVPELIEVSIDTNDALPQVEVIIDRGRAYNLGLSINAIANEVSAAMNGVNATTFRWEGNEYYVVLELRDEDKAKLPDLGRIFVASNTGNLIPVSNFAKLEKGLGPVSVGRENQTRVIHITGTLAKTNISASTVEQKIKDTLAAELILPDGCSISYEGQAGQVSDTMRTFMIIVVLAIILVFGTLAGIYESFKDPFINMFTIPLVFIGVVAIYLVTGQTISMFTMIGLVMLVGIVTNNSIILIDYTNLLVGRGMPVRQACIEGGAARLRPVLMTALSTILGLIPLAFFPGRSSAFIQPIGLTVIGGLFSSTFITLFFIPVLYSLFNERRHKKEEQKQ